MTAEAMNRWERWRLRLHMRAPRLKLTCAGQHLGSLGHLGCASCCGFRTRSKPVSPYGSQYFLGGGTMS